MTSDGLSDHFMQFLLNIINEGYEQYKLDHPDFAKVVERDLEGKTEEEFEALFNSTPNYVLGKKKTHCESCGEWLQGFDTCSECGRINL